MYDFMRPGVENVNVSVHLDWPVLEVHVVAGQVRHFFPSLPYFPIGHLKHTLRSQ